MTIGEKHHETEEAPESPARFWWFRGASVRQLGTYLREYESDAIRLEVHRKGDGLVFRVFENGTELGEINDSFICPPRCPT